MNAIVSIIELLSWELSPSYEFGKANISLNYDYSAHTLIYLVQRVLSYTITSMQNHNCSLTQYNEKIVQLNVILQNNYVGNLELNYF